MLEAREVDVAMRWGVIVAVLWLAAPAVAAASLPAVTTGGGCVSAGGAGASAVMFALLFVRFRRTEPPPRVHGEWRKTEP